MSNVELLSITEQRQLGTNKPGSSIQYINHREWDILRPVLVEKSIRSNPFPLDPDMIAYTPGETNTLLQRPEILSWHNGVERTNIPDIYQTIIFVPCAKTKPWDQVHSRHSQLYFSYHQVIQASETGLIEPVFFVTISEPLGIVPQNRWGDFPQYDNPGLFESNFLRTGMVTKDWVQIIGAQRHLPFDHELYRSAINNLGNIIATFLEKNRNRIILSFVENTDKTLSTHGDMLNTAIRLLNNKGIKDIQIKRFPKRNKPHEPPYEFIMSKIKNFA